MAPLDWGLGHATRCIPIIRELYSEGFQIFIGASGNIFFLLKNEFPDAKFLPIPNYNIRYSKTKRWFPLRFIFQIPKIYFKIREEKKWIRRQYLRYKFDIIISDNRPGLWHPKAHCIYITHQLNFCTPIRIFNQIASSLHKHYIKRFDQCWIPDVPDGLSGKLSVISPSPENYQFIGPLSRMEPVKSDVHYDIAMILSGPEPQRTIFEKILLEQAYKSNQKIIIVQGLPRADKTSKTTNQITIVNHLDATELNKVICGSSLVIGRSGYTSVMDYARLNTKAVLVPTPGQPEQEYLARYLSEKKYFICAPQTIFSLETVIEKIKTFPFRPLEFHFDLYKAFIHELKQKKDSPLHIQQ